MRHTYVRAQDGPWLLYDNETDPYQMDNLVNAPEPADLQAYLEALLQQKLTERNDAFLPGEEYLKRDGLTHYREVHCKPNQRWRDPWKTDGPIIVGAQ